MNLLLPTDQLHSLSKTGDFILKTQQQLAKDFARAGYAFDSEFTETTLTFDLILEQVMEKLGEAFERGEKQMLQLLYLVDLPQQEFLRLIQEPEFLSRLSDKIIRREAYKVYLRTQF